MKRLTVENQVLQMVVNSQKEDGSTESVLLSLYPVVKITGIEGLDDYLQEKFQDFLKDTGILEELEALRNGEGSTLTENPNEMNFKTLDGISVVKGVWDEENKRIYC